MAKFFKDGFTKLQGVLNAPQRPSAGSEPTLPAYGGKLTAGDFSLSQGGPLGLGAVVPKTVAHEPRSQLIGIGTAEGHVHLFGQDVELCLKNPATPVQPEFLFFPRPGLLVMFGLATPASSKQAGWIAQWWDLRSGGVRKFAADPKALGGIGAPQLLALRFSIMCATVSQDDASLVFLGTDEGDVRVFDGGESPHMGAYCIPWDKLLADGQRSSKDVMRPCPVMALAAAPARSGAELLIGGAEGVVVLWSFERNRASRMFKAPGTITSLVWHASGASFLASSRSEIAVFSKSNSTALARVPMPGGPASSVTLLRWCDVDDSADARAPKPGENPLHGEVLLRRGAPGPAVLNIWGPEWAQIDDLVPEAGNPVTGAVLCLPARTNVANATQTEGKSNPCDPDFSDNAALGASFGTMAVPCGCMAPPLSVIMQGAVKRSVIFERLAAAPLLLVAIGDPGTRLMVCTVPPMRKLAWPATWGSLELAGTTTLSLVARDSKPLSWPSTTVDQAECDNLQTVHISAVEGGSICGAGQSLPEEASIESIDGWLVCNADAEDATGGQGVHWELAAASRQITCKIRLQEGACLALVLASSRGEDRLLFDQATRRVSILGLHAGDSDQDPQTDVQAGEHTLAISQKENELNVHWDESHVCSLAVAEATSVALSLRAHTGVLHIESMVGSEEVQTPVVAPVKEQPVKTPAAAAEAMFARRFANFSGFVAGGYELDPEPWHFVDVWNSMVGGWQGLLCSGHRDGRVRIWLRAHSTVLLLHTLSVQPLAPLPWRPQLASHADPEGIPHFRDVQRARWYDGVDACPAVVGSHEDADRGENAWPWQITTISFEPATGALAAGTGNGAVFLFRWRDAPAPLSLAEYAEWKEIASLREVEDAGGVPSIASADAELRLPTLPAGFACVLRFRQHHAAVTRAQFVSTASGRVHVVSMDATALLCIADADSGVVLFRSTFADCLPAHVVDPTAATSSSTPAPPPPTATIEAVVLADRLMHAQTAAADQTKGNMPKCELMEGEPRSDTYILAVSSGELRQMAVSSTAARLLDGRIRETRLPALAGGPVLLMELSQSYLLIVQPGAAHLLSKPTESELAMPYSTAFTSPALSAGLVEIDGEICLCVVFASLAVHILGIPSLRVLARASAAEQAAPFLAHRGSRVDAFWSSDGYFVLRSASPEGTRLWTASISAGLCALDEAARMVPAASIAQASGPPREQPSGNSRAGGAGFGASLLTGLFGGGQKSMRECVAPAGNAGLPSEVDAANVDRNRGLAPAWRDPTARPPEPPGPRPGGAAAAAASTARSSATSANKPAAPARAVQSMQGELAQANARAIERGEKLSELGNKSQQLADDSANFLKMAKQLNAKQSSWF